MPIRVESIIIKHYNNRRNHENYLLIINEQARYVCINQAKSHTQLVDIVKITKIEWRSRGQAPMQ